MTKSEKIREFHDVLTLGELAEVCDCSRAYVRRVIRDFIGKSRSKPKPHRSFSDVGLAHECEKARARCRRKFTRAQCRIG